MVKILENIISKIKEKKKIKECAAKGHPNSVITLPYYPSIVSIVGLRCKDCGTFYCRAPTQEEVEEYWIDLRIRAREYLRTHGK